MQKTQIAPSLLSADFGRLAEEIGSLEKAGADILHLDVMDGHYVPNLSFGFPLIHKIRALTKLPLDVHLMVTNPGFHVPRLIEIGVQMISFHQETEYHSHRLVNLIKSNGIKAGLALNPAVPVNTLDSIISELDFVLMMSVNPGYSAQPFIESVVSKIRAMKDMRIAKGNEFLIEVDGGVSAANASTLKQAGADILVSASYIFNNSSYLQAISSLRDS
jgi:ribulose-phosphate 3-epimerase